MDDKKLICNECKTENEEKYEYCKNCGAKLNRTANQSDIDPFTGYPLHHQEATEQPQNSYSYTAHEQQYPPYSQSKTVYGNSFVEAIDGIPYSEFSAFIGKKADKYMPVFSKMEITATKTSWHWPCALLSFFIGPLGSAIWFFYRKMYKLAIIFAIIGTILSVASALMIGEGITDLSDPLASFSELMTEESEPTKSEKLAEALTGLSEIATTVICGIFTHYWYKKHIHKSIINYRAANVDPRYYQIGLAAIGGTSGGLAALGIAITLFLPSSVTQIIYLIL